MPRPPLKGEPSSPSPGKGGTKGKKSDPSIAQTSTVVPSDSRSLGGQPVSEHRRYRRRTCHILRADAVVRADSQHQRLDGLQRYTREQLLGGRKPRPSTRPTRAIPSTSSSRRLAVYNPKTAAALAGNNPPALTFGWGGGRELQYINAKVVAPIGDAGQSDAGNPSWKSDFLPASLGAVTFNNKLYGIPVGWRPSPSFSSTTSKPWRSTTSASRLRSLS